MDSLLVENVRCFAGRHVIPLAPLTLLVGENNSGKSTLLALCRLARDVFFSENPPNFNEEPFLLGAFEQIAHQRAQSDHAHAFTIGFGVRLQASFDRVPNSEVLLSATFERAGPRPEITRFALDCPPFHMYVVFREDRKETEVVFDTPSGKCIYANAGVASNQEFGVFVLRRYIEKNLFDRSRARVSSGSPPATHDVEYLDAILEDAHRTAGGRPYALAPIRPRPQRTYDPIADIRRPDGTHTPLMIRGMCAGESGAMKRLADALSRFGRQCHLFDEVSAKRLGDSDGDPFQLEIKVSGSSYNVMDVGYGVSQVLPILVDAVMGDPREPLLLQQPEVHLHPRAQAELGTFLGSLVKEQGRQCIVETHSDHLTDRVRMDIRDKRGITAKDVSLLYFEHGKKGVEIHKIDIDDSGNVKGAPPGYRRFFLAEEQRFLEG